MGELLPQVLTDFTGLGDHFVNRHVEGKHLVLDSVILRTTLYVAVEFRLYLQSIIRTVWRVVVTGSGFPVFPRDCLQEVFPEIARLSDLLPITGVDKIGVLPDCSNDLVARLADW